MECSRCLPSKPLPSTPGVKQSRRYKSIGDDTGTGAQVSERAKKKSKVPINATVCVCARVCESVCECASVRFKTHTHNPCLKQCGVTHSLPCTQAASGKDIILAVTTIKPATFTSMWCKSSVCTRLQFSEDDTQRKLVSQHKIEQLAAAKRLEDQAADVATKKLHAQKVSGSVGVQGCVSVCKCSRVCVPPCLIPPVF